MLRLLAALLAIVLGLVFHSRNHDLVRLDLYLLRIELPLSFVVVGALALGAGLGILALMPSLWVRGRLLREAQRRPDIPPAQGTTLTTQAASTPHGR